MKKHLIPTCNAVLDALLHMIIAKRWDYATPVTCPPGRITCPGGDEAKCHACWLQAAEEKAHLVCVNLRKMQHNNTY